MNTTQPFSFWEVIQDKKVSLSLILLTLVAIFVTIAIWMFVQRIGAIPQLSEFWVIGAMANAVIIPTMGYFVITFVAALIIFGIE